MLSKHVAGHTSNDGILNLKIPLDIKNQDVDVMLLIETESDKAQNTQELDSFRGRLQNSPNLQEAPLAIQQKLRDEWT